MEITKETKKYRTILTKIGREKIAAAALNGTKVDITTAVVTDGGGLPFKPDETLTELPHEVWRGAIADKSINAASANMIDVRIYLDGSAGGFTVRGVGLLDSAGDLIAVGNLPDTEKAVVIDGAASTLTLVIHIVVSNVDVVEFRLDPSVDTVSSVELKAAIQAHNEDESAHADLREQLARLVTVSSTPPEKSGFWFCSGDWRPEQTTVLTAKLGSPADAEQASVTAEVNSVQYPVTNAALDMDSGTLVLN